LGLFGFILLIVVILAIIGMGWKTFSSGVVTGFEKAVDVGTPIMKNLTQEAKDHMNTPEQLNTIQQIQNSEEF
jgi:predicted negative regulator of RcsB-dependent stress response